MYSNPSRPTTLEKFPTLAGGVVPFMYVCAFWFISTEPKENKFVQTQFKKYSTNLLITMLLLIIKYNYSLLKLHVP